MARKSELPAGTVISGPGGMGYRLTREVHAGDPVRATDCQAFGGAPVPKAGEAVEPWLMRGILAEFSADA